MARESSRRRRTAGTLSQLPWRQHRNPYGPIEVLNAEQLEKIHDASLRIL